jgi:hypothetical protein
MPAQKPENFMERRSNFTRGIDLMKALSGAFVLGSALLVFAAGAWAGAYQRTLDRQTLVWNNYPKPYDQAEWSGHRDSSGYAVGPGTLTWYKNRVLMGRYSGTMVRGKWNGLVTNVDADGKKFRGTFVDGAKSGDWVEVGDASGGASQASAIGTYQKTYDGRAYVWNNYPKADDQVMWSGETDSAGYATGIGQLAWYKNRTLVSGYAGNMVRGKWNGIVTNEDVNGKKFQGTYVDGVKQGDWILVDEFRFRRELTPEEKALNAHWAQYLRHIQAGNDYPNWSAPPYDLFVKNNEN